MATSTVIVQRLTCFTVLRALPLIFPQEVEHPEEKAYFGHEEEQEARGIEFVEKVKEYDGAENGGHGVRCQCKYGGFRFSPVTQVT